MIIYSSYNKIQNLLMETGIRSNFFYSIFNFKFSHLQIGGESGFISAELSNERNQKAQEIKSVLKSLKSNGRLVNLLPNTPIKRLNYISSSGTMEYVKVENGFTASKLSRDNLEKVRRWCQFFDDDILHFKININHEQYDSIKIKCTAANIEVFGKIRHDDLFENETFFLNYPHSGDPGIFYHTIPVSFIVWTIDTNPNDRSIEGSPVIIYC